MLLPGFNRENIHSISIDTQQHDDEENEMKHSLWNLAKTLMIHAFPRDNLYDAYYQCTRLSQEVQTRLPSITLSGILTILRYHIFAAFFWCKLQK